MAAPSPVQSLCRQLGDPAVRERIEPGPFGRQWLEGCHTDPVDPWVVGGIYRVLEDLSLLRDVPLLLDWRHECPPAWQDMAPLGPVGLQVALDALSEPTIVPKLTQHPRLDQWLRRGEGRRLDDESLRREITQIAREGQALRRLPPVSWWLGQLSGPEQAELLLTAAHGGHPGAAHLVDADLNSLTGAQAAEVLSLVTAWLGRQGRNLENLWREAHGGQASLWIPGGDRTAPRRAAGRLTTGAGAPGRVGEAGA